MMNKYLKAENASITIEYNKDVITNFFKNQIKFIDNVGVQRLYILCNVSDLAKLYCIISPISFNNFLLFIKVYNYNDEYFDLVDEINKKYYCIISSDVKKFSEFKYNNELFYELNFEYNECYQIVELLKIYSNVILNINYDLSNLKNVNQSLLFIVNNSFSSHIYFNNMFIDSDLIKKCPYNIYVNNKQKQFGENIPRNLFIDNEGNLYCLEIKSNLIKLGNILSDDTENLLFNCKSNLAYKNFINFNEKLFMFVLDQCPFKTIDYISFFKGVIKYYE